jgi:tRNA (guanine37-N1)-methyltransferase
VRIDVVTIFPAMLAGPLEESILGRARSSGLVQIGVHDLRDYTTDRHRTTDDAPYGGGAGMVMRPEPLFAAVEALTTPGADVILMTPQGRVFDQSIARELSGRQHLILLCGRYEGFDERVRQHLATDELSIGDYVLTGGELPALVVIDAVVRLLPGVLGSAESLAEESHAGGLLEYPHFTRPPELRGWTVPEVLLSGNHAAIARWRREQALLRTLARRPDLLGRAELDSADRRFLAASGAPELLRPEDAEPPRRRDRRRPSDRADGPGDRER